MQIVTYFKHSRQIVWINVWVTCSTMAAKEVQIRIANGQDLNSVLDINQDVYEGFDYLPSVYFELVHDKNVLMFIGEVNHQVVCI